MISALAINLEVAIIMVKFARLSVRKVVNFKMALRSVSNVGIKV